MKVPRSREQAELEKVPRGERPEIEERILKANIISQEHEEGCWFWLSRQSRLFHLLSIWSLCHHHYAEAKAFWPLILDAHGNKRRCNRC